MMIVYYKSFYVIYEHVETVVTHGARWVVLCVALRMGRSETKKIESYSPAKLNFHRNNVSFQRRNKKKCSKNSFHAPQVRNCPGCLC